ncbi:hypothetical protein SAMN04487934_105131 [Eubacterium ruminantium]|nr:hypothetical protein SAMN04487934_105131 [Eubacterium ruminantium]
MGVVCGSLCVGGTLAGCGIFCIAALGFGSACGALGSAIGSTSSAAATEALS